LPTTWRPQMPKIDHYVHLSSQQVFDKFGEDVSSLRGSKIFRGEVTTMEVTYDRFLGRFSVTVWCGS